MSFDLSRLKEVRQRLGITQNELSNLAGVSQSLIAKVESGRLDPTYSNAGKIINAIEQASKKSCIKAKEMMNSKIVSCSPEENINSVVVKMNKNDISQIPVIDNTVVGLVSERSILDSISNPRKTVSKAKEIMEGALPIVSSETPSEAVVDLLKHFPIALVSENGKLKGIITKSDIITKLYGKR